MISSWRTEFLRSTTLSPRGLRRELRCVVPFLIATNSLHHAKHYLAQILSTDHSKARQARAIAATVHKLARIVLRRRSSGEALEPNRCHWSYHRPSGHSPERGFGEIDPPLSPSIYSFCLYYGHCVHDSNYVPICTRTAHSSHTARTKRRGYISGMDNRP